MRHVDIQQVVRLSEAGLSSEEIAAQVGCGASYIRRMLRQQGRAPTKWRKPLPPPDEIARMYRELGSLDKVRAYYGVALYRIAAALEVAEAASPPLPSLNDE